MVHNGAIESQTRVSEMSDLTHKQRLFIDAYLECWNATESARRAGYQGNDITLASVGYENIRKPHVADRIKRRLSESAMTADEALFRLAAQARGNVGDFIDEHGVIDWRAVKDGGHLFKEITHLAGQRSSFKMHDAQAALVHILKYHGVFIDKSQQLNIDLDKLTTEQLERIVEGEDPIHVLATTSKG